MHHCGGGGGLGCQSPCAPNLPPAGPDWGGGAGFGSARFSRGKDETLKYTDSTINQLRVGINPGIAIFIMPNVGAEVSFGVAGFTYNWEKQKKSNGEEGKRTNSGANFKINLFNINIGITVCI